MRNPKRLKRLLSFVLMGTLLLASAIGTAYAAEGDDLDPDVYDIFAIEAGVYDRETNQQLSDDFDKDTLLIKFHPQSMFPGKEKQYQDEMEKVLKWGFDYIEAIDTYVVAVEDLDKNPNAVLNRFKNNRFIEFIEPNYLGAVEAVPNDPNYSTGKTFASYINAEAGWSIATGSSVPVALIDTGYSGNSDLPSANGYSVFNKNYDLTDIYGHGTRVAGTLGANGNNRTGNAGVVWTANLMPIKVSESASVSAANAATAVIWAADNGARIINISIAFASESATLKKAIDYAYNKGCIIVAGTGNEAISTVRYPAAHPNVLAVGGTLDGKTRFSSSNYGTGLDVLASFSWNTTDKGGGFATVAGTSIATPQVAGLAALVWELAPNLTNAQVMQVIRDNTNCADGRWDMQTGYGIIDMGKTLAAVQKVGGAPFEAKDTVAPVLTLKGNTMLEMPEGGTYEEPGYSAIDDKDGDITHLVSVTGRVDTAFAGQYKLTYTVLDKTGNAATATRTITVTAVPVPDVKPPVISQVGSNPIILHLGGTPYIEQGAVAFDDRDGDISSRIVIGGNVDTSRAGEYRVTYSVTNSAGLSASITRTVRVLAPRETITRVPHSFSVSGKVNASSSNSITANAAGIVTLNVTVANKTSGRFIIKNSAGIEVLNQVFSGNGAKDLWLEEGTYTITGTIVEGNGNTNVAINLLMPEVIFTEFAEEEIPLAPFSVIPKEQKLIRVTIESAER